MIDILQCLFLHLPQLGRCLLQFALIAFIFRGKSFYLRVFLFYVALHLLYFGLKLFDLVRLVFKLGLQRELFLFNLLPHSVLVAFILL